MELPIKVKADDDADEDDDDDDDDDHSDGDGDYDGDNEDEVDLAKKNAELKKVNHCVDKIHLQECSTFKNKFGYIQTKQTCTVIYRGPEFIIFMSSSSLKGRFIFKYIYIFFFFIKLYIGLVPLNITLSGWAWIRIC